ncbi:hypothetical protein J2785_002920 [Burkholderia ambifaria]|nr:hypothetical protein [Burkholderia ambifaria]
MSMRSFAYCRGFFWLAVAATLEVAEGRFGLREVQHHQSDRRVVHIRQQRAGRRPFLEPSMIAASRSGSTRPSTPGAPSAGKPWMDAAGAESTGRKPSPAYESIIAHPKTLAVTNDKHIAINQWHYNKNDSNNQIEYLIK